MSLTHDQFMAALRISVAKQIRESLVGVPDRYTQAKMSGINMTLHEIADAVESGSEIGDALIAGFVAGSAVVTMFKVLIEEVDS